MKEYILIILGLAVVLAGALWVMRSREAPPRSGGVACTTDAKFCLDGSTVGRVGPNCEFAPCPTTTATNTGTATATATTTAGSAKGILPYDSGVRGTVSLGPTCPVERDPPDPLCADKPYATTVTVRRAGSSTPFMIGSSDATGAFHFALPPGSYTITAGSGTKLPLCGQASVIAIAHTYVTTAISCDTGIR